MSDISQTLPAEARKERRRLHLREVAIEPQPEVLVALPPTETVGTLLRNARIARGEDAAAVASRLKMRREQLEAIEDGNLAKLPGRTYAVGFVRAYARHLSLDAEALVQQFKDETAGQDIDKPVDLVFPTAPEEYRARGNSVLVLALFIAMVIYGLSYLTIPGQQGARLAQAEETQAVIVEPPKPAPAPAKPAPALSQHTPVEVAVKFTAGKNALPDHQVPVPAALAPVAPVETVAPFALAQAATSQPAEPAQPAARILLKAVEPTYIQIRDPKLPRSRSILIARVLNVGESYAAPDRAGLVMQTGNAGGLQVEVDGRSLGVMGRSGEVITRMPLDPSYFLEREATTQ